MKFSHRHTFDATPARVIALFADPEYAASRGNDHSTAAPVVEGTVEDGFRVVTRAKIPSDQIPARFRQVIGDSVDVTYTEAWGGSDGDTWKGTFAVDVAGAPGHAAGELTMEPHEDGAELTARGLITVNVPLLGSTIERALVDPIIEVLEGELSNADEWLAR